MSKSRDVQNKKLTDLSIWVRAATATNNERVERAHNILKLAELARKLESVNEKVKPFIAENGENGSEKY